jgi:hypothetical protein
MHKLSCIVCEKEFTASRSDKATCSGKCRVAAHRRGLSGKRPAAVATPAAPIRQPAPAAAPDAVKALKAELKKQKLQSSARLQDLTNMVNALRDEKDDLRFELEKERRKAAQPAPAATPEALEASLPPTAKARLEAAIAAHAKRLDREYEFRVREAASALSNEYFASTKAFYDEKCRQLLALADRRNKPFNDLEFNTLLRLAHPDTGPHVDAETRNEMTRKLRERKAILADDPEVRKRAEELRARIPTAEQREAARAAVKAENSARAKKAAATRAAKKASG